MELTAKEVQFSKFLNSIPKERIQTPDAVQQEKETLDQITQLNTSLIKQFETQIEILKKKKSIRGGIDEMTQKLINLMEQYNVQLGIEVSFDVPNELIANARKMLVAQYDPADTKTHSVPIGQPVSPNLLSPVEVPPKRKAQTPPPKHRHNSKSLYFRRKDGSYGPI